MDREITEQIREFLRPKFDLKSFLLEFDYNQKHYKIQMKASHTDDKIAVENPCVMMDFNYTNKNTGDGSWLGEIEANTKDSPCFEPRIVTNARNKPGKRTTAADVLQVLKTKLALAFPVRKPVTLNDGAGTNTYMRISPFHLMRGGDAFYEKYGYRSPEITELKEALPSVCWADCLPEQKELIRACTKVTDFPADMPLIDIMKTISWDQENTWNNANEKILSYRVFRLFATTKGYPLEITNQNMIKSIWIFTLHREGPQWKQWEAELVFTAFHPEATGGRRKGRRTRRGPFYKKRRLTRRYRNPPRKNTEALSLSLSNNSEAAGNVLYSPVSSPGASNTNNEPNTPITRRARQLAKLYPNLRGMLNRSTSFGSSNNLLNEAGWTKLEQELGTVNEEYFPERARRY